MRKIEFKILNEPNIIFIKQEFLIKISSLSGRLERGGYIFASKIKDTNEYIVEALTSPQKNDICEENFVELSNRHKKLSRKIQKKNKLYEIGFYHTHPNYFGCFPSSYDLDYFKKISKAYNISLFIIGVHNKTNIIIYSLGKQIHKEII